jgi:general secretion pathway protein G
MRVGRANHQSGFTIIELLIVIVVIGILAALILTAYGNIQGKAQASVTKNIVQQYSKALLAYKVDNGHYPRQEDLDQNEISALPNNVNNGGACQSDARAGLLHDCAGKKNRGQAVEGQFAISLG